MCEHLLVDRFLFADPLTAAQTNQRGIPDAHTKASSTIASATLLSEPRGAIAFLRGPPRVKLFFAVRFGVFLSPHSQRCEALAKKWTGEFYVAVSSSPALRACAHRGARYAASHETITSASSSGCTSTLQYQEHCLGL